MTRDPSNELGDDQPASTESVGGHGRDPKSVTAPPSSFEVGQVVLGKYRIERRIGSGGMAEVALATHVTLGSRVALKFPLGRKVNAQISARMMREAKVGASLDPERAARIYDILTTDDGVPVIVMEYLEGQSLADRLAARGALGIEAACHWVYEACLGLRRAHEIGVVHRDVKPSNLFIEEIAPNSASNTRSERLRILDFGVASLRAAQWQDGPTDLTSDESVLGSLAYAAPEQLQRATSADARSDVWALGVTLFQLATNTLPFKGRGLQMMEAVKVQAAPTFASVGCRATPALEALLQSCLSKAPSGRPASASELAELLVRAVPHVATSKTPSTAPPPLASSGTGTDPSIDGLRRGDSFGGRYRIVGRLNERSFGTVYEVVDEKTNWPRALKVMAPHTIDDHDKRARFAQEARVTGGIESEHIVRVSDAGIDEATNAPFLVTDLLRGEDFVDLLKDGPISQSDALSYLTQIAAALDKAHAAGIVHRNLQPANLFLTHREDGSACLKLLDFGLAKVIGAATNSLTQSLGAPFYMAPEQIRGEAGRITPRTDIYALGHLAYAFLVGEPYWTLEGRQDASVVQLLMKVLDGVQERASTRAARRGISLPPSFDNWFQRCTAVDEVRRFGRASAAIEALQTALAPRSGSSLSQQRPAVSPTTNTEPDANVFPSLDVPSASDARTNDLTRGTVVAGRYRINELIGGGGQGAVYKATPVGGGAPLALKLLHYKFGHGEVALKRFYREIATLQRLVHPAIVRMLDCGHTADGTPFIVFELLNGRSLRQVLRANGPIGLPRTLQLATTVLAALEAAHASGVVHRDIKPENIFLSDDGQIRLLDFGIAKAIGSEGSHHTRLTSTGQMLGTPHYIAPEQARGGEIGPPTDLYSLGLVLCECISGKRVVEGDSAVEVVLAHAFPQPLTLPDTVRSTPLGAIVERALQKPAELRWSSAREMRDAVRLLSAEGSLRAASAQSTADMPTEPRGQQQAATVAFQAPVLGSAPQAYVPSPAVTMVPEPPPKRPRGMSSTRKLLLAVAAVSMVLVGGASARALGLFGKPSARPKSTQTEELPQARASVVPSPLPPIVAAPNPSAKPSASTSGGGFTLTIELGNRTPIDQLTLKDVQDRLAKSGYTVSSAEETPAVGNVVRYRLSYVHNASRAAGRVEYIRQPSAELAVAMANSLTSSERPNVGVFQEGRVVVEVVLDGTAQDRRNVFNVIH